MRLLSNVQHKCLRTICGAFRNSSGEAVEVICNIRPIHLRLEELCIREEIKLHALHDRHPLKVALNESLVNPSLDPISYLWMLARSMHKKLENAGVKIKKRDLLAQGCHSGWKGWKGWNGWKGWKGWKFISFSGIMA